MTIKLEEWPDGRLRRLAELWPDPTRSIRAITDELGVSRNAVRRRAKELGGPVAAEPKVRFSGAGVEYSGFRVRGALQQTSV